MAGERQRVSFIVKTACALSLLAPAVQAQSAPGFQYTGTLFSQMNPRALALDLRVQYREMLGSGDGLLGASAIGAFAGLTAAPGMLRPSVGLEIQPLATASLGITFGIGYSAAYYFGFLPAQSYPSPHSNYGSTVFSAPADGPGGGYALLVHQLTLSATLQGVVGPFAARSTTRAIRFFAGLHGSDTVVYDPTLDVAVYKDGWAGQNDTDVLYSTRPDLALGLRHTLTVAWYPSDAYSPGEPRDNPNTPISKLGPFALWRFFQSERGMVQRADLLLMAQWYLLHRYRTGETVNGAFPLLAIGLVFSGDLQRIH
jgi:hypothetical protein